MVEMAEKIFSDIKTVVATIKTMLLRRSVWDSALSLFQLSLMRFELPRDRLY